MPEETPKRESTAVAIAIAMSALRELILLINTLRAQAQQRGEWTPAQEAEFIARRDAITAQAHWNIEP